MSPSKPTIVFFPGAFHTTSAFMPVKAILEEQSYLCILSPNAASLGSADPSNVDLDTDVSYFRDSVILPLLDDEKEVVLVLHSYAGASAGGAVQGLTTTERQKTGQTGGIRGLICMSAICLPLGLSIQDTLQMTDELAPWTTVDIEKGTVSVKNDTIATQQFYSKLPADEAKKWVAELQHQSLGTFKTRCKYSPYTDKAWKGRLAYLLSEEDQTFPLQLQQIFVQSGSFDFIETLPTSHCPFLDMPDKTADVIIKFITAFENEDSSG